VLNENIGMLAMCRALGFTIAPDPSQNGVSLAKLDVTRATEHPSGRDA
jgi:hypothetical protein